MTTPEPKEEAPEPQNCPRDTDGDGNCGQVACPQCGKYGQAPQQDLSDTPVPQRRVDLYSRKNEISDRFYPRD